MNWFKTYWQSVIIVILIVLLLVGGCSYNQFKFDSKTQLAIKDEMLNDSVSVYKNKNGELISQKKALEVDIDNLEDNLEELGINESELKQQIGRLKNLNNRLSAQVETLSKIQVEDTVKDAAIVISDSIFTFGGDTQWQNEYILTTGRYNISGKYFLDSSSVRFSDIVFKYDMEYKYTVDFTTTSYWKRENKVKFWQPKYLVTDIKFSDPNANVVSIQSIDIVEPPKRFYEKNSFWFVVGGITGFVLK